MTPGGSVCRHGRAGPVPPAPAVNGPDADGPARWRLPGGAPA